MDYTNLHTQHQLQEQVISGQSSLPIAPSTATITANNWNPTIILPWPSATATTFTTSTHDHEDFSYNTSTTDHSKGFNVNNIRSRSMSANINESFINANPNIKEEPSSDSFSKLRINIYKQQNDNNIVTMSNSSPITSASCQNYMPGIFYNISSAEDLYSNNIAQNNIMTSFGAGFTGVNNDYDHDNNHLGRHVFSNIISTSTNTTPTTPRTTSSSGNSLMLTSSGGLNLQALDLLSSPTYRSSQSCSSPSSHSNNLTLYRELSTTSNSSFGHGDMQESGSTPSNSPNNMTTSAFFNEVPRTKRPNSFPDRPHNKESRGTEAKKSKSILRPSNPPLKVRKEKLGDRIAALHRLVAPFGKTDTASVLTEAIGYIQFLHDQVQTLSMPYMKSLQSKPTKKMPQVHGLSKEEDQTDRLKMDLRSRGLCLVPQTCVSYLNGFD